MSPCWHDKNINAFQKREKYHLGYTLNNFIFKFTMYSKNVDGWLWAFSEKWKNENWNLIL